ncbi:MAG: CHAT domain-containing protein [Gemmatimonadota bacterium]
MGSITIRISPKGLDFEVSLIEENQPAKSGLLVRASLTGGAWTALTAAGQAPPPTDIVQRLIGVGQVQRDHADFATIGETLYEWLFPLGEIRDRWTELPEDTTICLDAQDEELARLPWELARSPKPLRLAATNQLHRVSPRPPGPAGEPSFPFRILIVVGCSATEEKDLAIDREVRRIETEFRRLGRSVDVHSLRRPTFENLSDWVKAYHPEVLHFAGHGAKVPGKDEFGLLIEAAAGTWLWKSDDIPTDAALWKWKPTFVFLNACRSGVDRAAASSIQRGFLSSGARAVLGMQADIRGDLAGLFAAEVYRQCALGSSVQAAVSEGRLKVRGPAGGWNYIDWALPALVSTEPDLKLFRPREYPNDVAFTTCKEFEDARIFADGREGRRLFMDWQHPRVPPTAVQNVLVLTGPPTSGKSHLLKWSMESWAVAGARVRYLEIYGGSGKNFLDILRQIRDGESDGTDPTKYLHEGLPPELFRRFNWELNNRIDTGQPGEWKPEDHPAVIPDKEAPPKASGEQRLEEPVCASFHAALQEVAKKQQVILVFDRFTGPNGERLLPKEDFDQLVAHLFQPIAADADSSIKLVFCMNQAESTDYNLGPLKGEFTRSYDLPVQYSDADLEQLAGDMLWTDDPLPRELAAVLLKFPQGNRPLFGLARLTPVLKALEGFKSPLLAGVERMR